MAFSFDAEIRTDLGKGASRRLRRAGKVPAVIYGGNKDAQSISLEHNKIFIAQQDDVFYNENITLNVAGEQVVVKVVAMQRHPVKSSIVHLDFMRV